MLATALGAVIALGAVVSSSVIQAAPATASEGSVPAEITRYAAEGMVADLADLYGPGAGGTGIDFDETTTASAPLRVFVFTDDYLAGTETDAPTRRLNEWVTAISVADVVVGLATVGIADDATEPSLIVFDPDAETATAVGAVPADAALVRDAPVGAWLALTGESLAPLVAGESGLTSATTLVDYQRNAPDRSSALVGPAGTGDAMTSGFVIAGIVLVVVVVTIVLLALVPKRPRPERDRPKPIE